MIVATAAADIGNLRFYQRCGFRFTAVERDAFGPATGYPEPIVIDGIPLRDRVWLARGAVSPVSTPSVPAPRIATGVDAPTITRILVDDPL